MANLVFTCPTTKFKVQHWLEDDEAATDNEYKAITCQACARLHLINLKIGKLLGQDNDR
jgi:NAD-dependent dihydropyrimidine dehydrogenase PreA subunit